MLDELRTVLYPLGFLSALVFGARFILQWVQSEKAKRSTVSPLFWHLSLGGNILLALHGFIQFQFHICLIQACNTVISWRNLDLLQKNKPSQSLTKVIILLAATTVGICGLFFLQNLFFMDETWFRIPLAPWQEEKASHLAFQWHILGICGYILFSSRFWVQWILAEQAKQSYLPLSFWWLSLLGALTSVIYFIRIQDLVSTIGPLLGLLPYIRNLALIYKSNNSVQKA